MLLGLCAYVFFVVAARALGPERYAGLSVLWTLVFFAAPGFFFPLEQEVGRALSARRAMGVGGRPVVVRAGLAGGAIALGLALVTLALREPITDDLFDGADLLFVSLLVSLPAYALVHVVRGLLSGTGRFGAYGTLLASEGLIRVVLAIALALAGVTTTGAYGLLVGALPFVAVAVTLAPQRRLLEPGPPAPWTELSGALGWLLLGAVLAQGFVNAPVPIVKVLAGEGEAAIAGQFQAGLIVARVPLFLFQAVQAALLPKLSGLAASGRLADFRTGLRRLVAVVVVIGVAATIGAFAIGPQVLQLAFGSQFDDLDNVDLGLLALASAAFMLCQALAQALIALSGHARAAAGWAVAVAVLGVGIALGDDLLLRVELGLVAGALVGTGALSLLLMGALREVGEPPAALLVEALSPEHEIIEP